MQSSAVKRQPRLDIEELLHLCWLLGGGLALLSIWTSFYLETSIWPFALVATLAIVLCLLFPGAPAVIPRFAWRLGLPLIGVFFAVDLTLNEMILAFVRLNVLLVLYRAVSYRTRSEDLQLVALCLFLIVVNGVLTASMVFAVQILFFTALAMVFLFVVNVIHDADEEYSPARWAMISRKRLIKRLWRVFDLRLLFLGAGLFAAVIAISALIFLLIPRFDANNGLGFLRLNQTRSVTGFSETIALGEVTDIKQDNGIAMRVDVEGTDEVPPVPYWRMVVLDEYDNGSFRVSRAVKAKVGVRSSPMLDMPGDLASMKALGIKSAPTNARYVVFVEAGISRYLPLPGAFQRLRFKEMHEIVENDVFRTFSTNKQSAALMSFRIEGVDFSGVIPDPKLETRVLRAPSVNGRENEDEKFRLRFLSYPATTLSVPVSVEAQEYLKGVVDEITGGKTLDARAFAQRAFAWLAAHHHYSLGVSLPSAGDDEDQDPVVRWMKADLPGHCEFFAASFTLLSRAAGFPTRAVTGFKGGTWNAFENYFMIRNSDAHAWCEVYDGNGAWFRVDPTPGGGGVVDSNRSIAVAALASDHSFGAYFDSLRMLWYRRIVNFDQRSQKEVVVSLQNIGDTVSLWGNATAVTLWSSFQEWSNMPWTFRNKGDFLFTSVMVFLIATVMRKFGVGTSDVVEWFRRGEKPTRRRAGELLRRVRAMLDGPPRDGFDFDRAVAIERDLYLIRFGRTDRWPSPIEVFRAARRLL